MVWLPSVRYQNPKDKESVHIWQVTQPWESEFESSEDTIHNSVTQNSVAERSEKDI